MKKKQAKKTVKPKPKIKRKPKTKPAIPPRRSDWVVNDELITATYTRLLFTKVEVPSYEDIAAELKIDVSTVKRHIKEMDMEERLKKFQMATGRVLQNVFKKALGKNPHWARLWMESVEGIGSKKKVEVTGANGKDFPIPTALANASIDQLIAIIKASDHPAGQD